MFNLNGIWRMQDFAPGDEAAAQAFSRDYDDAAWMPARVPGDVHSALLALGKIPDPFFADNADHMGWVEKREWWFRTQVDLPESLADSDARWFLRFDGLDLFATAYLNGQRLGEHASMFYPAEFDVTALVNSGQNLIAVRFDPLRSRLTDEKLVPQMPEYDAHARAQVRKAQAQFMWDHTPPCLMVGLWQGVTLARHSRARLRWPHFRVLSLDAGQAVIGVDAAVEQWSGPDDLHVEISLALQPEFAADTPEVHRASVPVRDGMARAVLVVHDPVRWFPNGMGEPALYDLTVTLKSSDEALDTFTDVVGIRTVHVDQHPDPDEPGCQHFTIVVNDIPIFAKGANWVPTDLFNGRVTDGDYDEWLSLLREANGNMLRVWGGGQYEPDTFYRAADRLGILIWHDFMFAGASYPEHRPEFFELVRREAEYQVTRLRNRPCLALWCGNNELDWHLDEMLWDQPGAYYPGKRIMHELLPDVIRRLHPDCFYWPGSPFGGNDHNSQQAGDRHNWQTWHALADRRFGEKPKTIDDFDDKAAAVSYWHLGADQGRFISEFGIHASPVYETLRRNIPAGDLAYGSPGLAFRNRNIIRDRGDLMMQAHTGLPGSLDDYIDFSMMTQAEGLKYGIEHFRRRKFHCSGALFWQWNDNWPSITWSVLDYYRFPKAGYFYVKRAFAPVMLSIARDAGGGLSVHGVNDTLEPVGDVLEWRHVRFNGEVIAQSRLSFTLAANAAAVLHRFASGQFDDARPDEMLWLGSTNGHFPDNRWFFAPELKHLRRARPDVYVDWKREGGALLATLSAQEHAYFVNLTVPVQGVRYTDNWIDLYPGHSRELTLWHPDGREIDPAQVTVRWR